jgi:hypothetical protein
MVTTFAPSRAPIGTEQDRMAVPSICTVQAPHCAIPQPNFVPVKPITSRNTQRSGVSGSMSICRDDPLTSIVITVALPRFQEKTMRTAEAPSRRRSGESCQIGLSNLQEVLNHKRSPVLLKESAFDKPPKYNGCKSEFLYKARHL